MLIILIITVINNLRIAALTYMYSSHARLSVLPAISLARIRPQKIVIARYGLATLKAHRHLKSRLVLPLPSESMLFVLVFYCRRTWKYSRIEIFAGTSARNAVACWEQRERNTFWERRPKSRWQKSKVKIDTNKINGASYDFPSRRLRHTSCAHSRNNSTRLNAGPRSPRLAISMTV